MTVDRAVEAVARAIFDAANPIGDVFPNYWDRVVGGEATRDRYREWAAAAIAAMPPSPAEEAVKRVEALIDVAADRIRASTPPLTAERLIAEGTAPTVAVADIRAALASPAPAPQGEPKWTEYTANDHDLIVDDDPEDCVREDHPAHMHDKTLHYYDTKNDRVPWLEQVTPDSCGHTDREGCTGHGDF